MNFSMQKTKTLSSSHIPAMPFDSSNICRNRFPNVQKQTNVFLNIEEDLKIRLFQRQFIILFFKSHFLDSEALAFAFPFP